MLSLSAGGAAQGDAVAEQGTTAIQHGWPGDVNVNVNTGGKDIPLVAQANESFEVAVSRWLEANNLSHLTAKKPLLVAKLVEQATAMGEQLKKRGLNPGDYFVRDGRVFKKPGVDASDESAVFGHDQRGLERNSREDPGLVPYFGQFALLLRSAISAGGSEFGLGQTLFSLAVSTRASRILEIGRYKGFSTLALASGLYMNQIGWDEPVQHKQRPDVDYKALESPPLRKVTSLDPFPDPEATALLKKAGVMQFVDMVDKYSYQYEPEGPYDIIFVDGDHTYPGLKRDIKHVQGHLRAGGYLIVHDYFGWYNGTQNQSPIRSVVHELVKAGEYEQMLIDSGYMSFVVLRKPFDKPEMLWNNFPPNPVGNPAL